MAGMSVDGSSEAWPHADAFAGALDRPREAFEDETLQRATILRAPDGRPRRIDGTDAIVFVLETAGTAKRLALRCPLRALPGRKRRAAALAEFSKRHTLDALAPGRWLEQGIRLDDQWWPIQLLDWVDGEPLDVVVARHHHDGAMLRDLAAQFASMLNEMSRHGIAHGDLEPSNILVTTAGMRLVDLDDAYVPGLETLGLASAGHVDFQHPARDDAEYGPHIDHFSAWVIQTSLLATSLDPSLWTRFAAPGRMLYTQADFAAPHESEVLRAIRDTPGAAVLADRMEEALAAAADTVPPLDAVALPPPVVRAATLPTIDQAPDTAVVVAPEWAGTLGSARIAPLALTAGETLLVLAGVASRTGPVTLAVLALAQVGATTLFLHDAYRRHDATASRQRAMTRRASARSARDATHQALREAERERNALDAPTAPSASDGGSAVPERVTAGTSADAIARDIASLEEDESAQLRAALQEVQADALATRLAVFAPDATRFDADERATLDGLGIRTAADVTPEIAEAGVDPSLVKRLLDWREMLERRFQHELPDMLPPDVESEIRERHQAARAHHASAQHAQQAAAKAQRGGELARERQRAAEQERQNARARRELDARVATLERQLANDEATLTGAEHECDAHRHVTFSGYVRAVASEAFKRR